MNIGFVVHHFDSSDGTGGYAVEVVNRLAPRHRVTLYAAEVRSEPHPAVKVVRVPAVSGAAYAKILSFPCGFARVRGEHDIIHAQGWVTTSADIVTTHIVLGAWRDAAKEAQIRSAPGERYFGRFVTRMEKTLCRTAMHVIAPSNRAAEDVARLYRCETDVTVIPHGFPRPRCLPYSSLARNRFGIDDTAFVALYAGDARKGLRSAILALREGGAHLLVVSRSSPDAYLEVAAAAGVQSRVHWAGPLDDMLPAYAAADVLVHPTIYDTFAMVVAEAMAYGVPVILSPNAGVAELIEHGKSGWILRQDLSDLGEAITTLAQDQRARLQLATAALATANGWSWDLSVAATEAVYARVGAAKQAIR